MRTKVFIAGLIGVFCVGAFLYYRVESDSTGQTDDAAVASQKISPAQVSVVASRKPENQRLPFATTDHAVQMIEAYSIELSQIVIAEALPDLLERARKDPEFGYALAIALQGCSALKRADEQLVETSTLMLQEDAEELAVNLDKRYAPCVGLGNTAEFRFDLAEKAAEAKILQAQINYRALAADFVGSEGAMRRSHVMESYKSNTVRYALAAARTGSADALYNAYEVLGSGLFGPSDPVTAHAFLLAYVRSDPSRASMRLLAENAKHLDAQQLAGARAKVEEILDR